MFDPNVRRLAGKLFQSLNSPRALTCMLLMQSGTEEDLCQLVNLKADPRNYEPILHAGIERYRKDAQATEFLRKYPGFNAGIDRSRVAVEGFMSCEAQCQATNARIDAHLTYPVLKTKVQWAADRRLRRARAWLARVLGPIPDFLNGRFGPGVTFESKEWSVRKLVAYDKLHFSPSVTASAAWLVDHLVWNTAMAYSWAHAVPERLFPIAPGNRFTTTQKDATKDRGICIEAGINLFGQLAIGEHLKRCLRRVGIDLVRGEDLHKQLAFWASMLGNIATVDLSNASDTVALLLVKLLFPEDWFYLLDSLRSHYTDIRVGSTTLRVKLEKFSSMGNGFTFELETLLFCALLHAVGGKVGLDTFVYGDDMIIPSEIAPDALAFLRYCGFTPNQRKTFTDGYFRESCGGDFFNGADVRPYYLKKEPANAADWIGVANGLWEASRKLELPHIMAARNNALDNVPSDIRRCRGPQALGDLVVHDDDESKWVSTTRNSIRYLRVWRPVTLRKDLFYRKRVPDGRFGPPRPKSYIWVTTRRSKRYNPGVPLSAALLGLPSDGLSPRDSVGGWRFGRVAYS